MKCAVRCDQGRVRPSNQDSYLAENGIFAVADGMGGHQGGETASRMAIHSIRSTLLRSQPDPARLEKSVQIANRRIFDMSRSTPSLSGMGTTLSVLWPDNGCVHIAHVGDSRVYLLRDGHLIQLTVDHSYVAELVRLGEITREEARSHPYRNIITRAVGTDARVEVDILTCALKPGDLYLLCSDGLYGMVEDALMEKVLLSGHSLEEKADKLLELALEMGGLDNVTLLLLEGGDPA